MKILTNEYKKNIFDARTKFLNNKDGSNPGHNMQVSKEYSLLFQFIDKYLPVGFEEVNSEDPLLLEVDELMTRNRQYFYIADMVGWNILYASNSVRMLLGVAPSEFNPAFQFSITHPDDIQRHTVARSKMIQLSSELYAQENNYFLLSSNLRYKSANSNYINFLNQCYAFTRPLPKSGSYCLFVNTDIDWYGTIKHGNHYYLGKDLSYFRLPDKELILTGCIFSNREFEIVQLIRKGMESRAIAEKLFISSHTVDTHRRNILKKTNFSSTSELIINLQESGFF